MRRIRNRRGTFYMAQAQLTEETGLWIKKKKREGKFDSEAELIRHILDNARYDDERQVTT